MATINNLVSGGYSSSILNGSKEQMNQLRNQYRSNEINSEEYREKMEALKAEQSQARINAVSAGINAAENVSSLFSYMNHSGGGNAGGVWGSGTFDTNVFFGSSRELSTLQAMNSARIGIENRARALVGEIGRDRARGIDVSDRQEALSNLTGNLDILNRNLNTTIERALGDGGNDRNVIDIIERIRQSLADPPPEEVTQAAEDETVPPAGGSTEAAAETTEDAAVEQAQTAPEQAVEAGVTPANV